MIASQKVEPAEVHDFFDRSMHTLSFTKQWHWHSRCWFWLGDANSHRFLQQKKSDYLIFMPTQEMENALHLTFYVGREEVWKRYPDLLFYERLLFYGFFSEFVYGVDRRSAIEQRVARALLLGYVERLQADLEAIALFSTHAVNYFYLVAYLYGGEAVSPLLLDTIDRARSVYDFKRSDHCHLLIYLVTHIVINESRFYQCAVKERKEWCQSLLVAAEEWLDRRFDDLSLDTKLEFLVASVLIEYNTSLQARVLDEAECSRAATGGYIVDTHNSRAGFFKNETLDQAEHRNVLYIMATTPYVLPTAIPTLLSA